MPTAHSKFGLRKTFKYDHRKKHPVTRIDFDVVVKLESYGIQNPVAITLHDTESHDIVGIRDMTGIISYWQNTRYPSSDGSGTYIYGAHAIVDKEGHRAYCAQWNRIVYHCGMNTGRIGIEQVGFASFGLSVWKWRRKQMRSVAKLCAYLCHRYHISPDIDVDNGIHTHAMVTQKYPDATTHTDPGRYPLQEISDTVKGMLYSGYWYNYYDKRGNIIA